MPSSKIFPAYILRPSTFQYTKSNPLSLKKIFITRRRNNQNRKFISSQKSCRCKIAFVAGLFILSLCVAAIILSLVIGFTSSNSTSLTTTMPSLTNSFIPNNVFTMSINITSISINTTTSTISTNSTSTSTDSTSTSTSSTFASTNSISTSTDSTSTSTSSTSSSTDSTSTSTSSTSSSTTTSSTTSWINNLRWNGTGVTIAGLVATTGTAYNRLNFPIGLVIDSYDTLYAADSRNNRILKFSIGNLTGTLLAGQGNGASGSLSNYLFYPNDICLDSTGNLYIADTNNSRNQMWNLGSSYGITIPPNSNISNSTNPFSSPRGMAIDPNTNTIYISDSINHNIMSYRIGSNISSLVAGGNGPGINPTQLFDPRGLYFDSSTNSLLIANSGANNIVRWKIGDSNWTFVLGSINGTFGANSTSLYGPWDVTVDPMGNIYVVDRYNSRIQFFLSGQTNGTTIAGITGFTGTSATSFSTPLSLALDSQLNLYVADSWNHRIQKFQRY